MAARDGRQRPRENWLPPGNLVPVSSLQAFPERRLITSDRKEKLFFRIIQVQ
jgi:hypothetical protein